jgi:GTPase involved in cell partitioning and DNA repair
MDVTMIGLQNAGKSSLLRVLAVCLHPTVHQYLRTAAVANLMHAIS